MHRQTSQSGARGVDQRTNGWHVGLEAHATAQVLSSTAGTVKLAAS